MKRFKVTKTVTYWLKLDALDEDEAIALADEYRSFEWTEGDEKYTATEVA